MLEENRRHQFESVKLVEPMRQRREADRVKSVLAHLTLDIERLNLDLDEIRYFLQERGLHFRIHFAVIIDRRGRQDGLIWWSFAALRHIQSTCSLTDLNCSA